MQRFTVLFMLFVLFSVPVFSAEQRPDQVELSELEFTIEYPEQFQLTNGIDVFFKQDSELPLIDVSIIVDAGKIGVPNKMAGLEKLVAALLRNGGAGRWSAEQLDQQLEQLAAQVQVKASTYTTNFDMSVLREDAQLGVEILAAMVQEPSFDSQRFDINQQQLLESIRRRGDHAARLAQQVLFAKLYAGHPLANSSRYDTVAPLTVEDVKHYYYHHFSPQHTRIVISGDLTVAEAKQWLDHSFAAWQHLGEDNFLPSFKDSNPSGLVFIHRPIPQTTILLGEIGIEKNNPDLHAVQVMNYILGGGGFGSRLMREIRSNRGLAYSVYSYFSVGRRLLGSFIAGCETKNESVAEVVNLLRGEMEIIRQQPITAQELNQAKDSLINSFVFTFENTHALAKRIMSQQMYGYPENYLEEYRQRIAAVTIDDVQRVALKYLHPDQQLLILVGDREALQPSLKQLAQPVEEIQLNDLL
ncbi:MAG: hypothetical protein B6I37_02905 [Desulfobacteraceae bacterium 4572_35.2]|nr:MAG: hypothetical protein B6I37_02905 [Desulfobacteraceae bacterium 4572_35.2]